ncbi:MAG TPA: serine/threonine-protein kinase, partial [Polyangia bacterium]|nr:serine/threonine-protein kinase [Polyangia bacterium]
MVISEPTVSVPARYRLIEEVGQGGMAVVYRAKDDSLKREVAIKVLHRHLASEPESKARLEREAQAVAKLRHDNILEIFDYSGADAQSAYLVTEFIDGQTLKQFLTKHMIKHPEVAMLIAVELCGALVHAHGMGIIHRDIKPENVMIRKDGVLKLMDFGIAQVLDLERMTVTGQLLGSPAYMAPELIEGKALDVRTDVFSVGILLYQMATGTLPFSGKNPHEVLRKITEGRFPDPRSVNRLAGAGIARIMSRALAHDPDARYATMQALLVDLREQLDDAGLRSAREELATYFQDPETYERQLPDRMTPALMSTGEKHVAIHNSARAIECW